MKNDTHGSNEEEWIGFDLDGTLARYDGWKGIEHIGEPVERMVLIARLLHWLGKKIKILTARVAPRTGKDDSEKAREYVQKWCDKNLGFVPDITYVKDASMVALFDDRAVAVEANSGKVLGGWPDALPKASDKAKNAIMKTEKKAERLYTYLPNDNTALKDGILSTVLTEHGFEKYRGRTGKFKKEDVLRVLDSWEPEWTRSKAISALTQPIPEDADEDFLEFSRDKKLYSFDVKELAKAKILAHIRRSRKGGGTDPVESIQKERPNWHRKKKHLLFQGVPHYFIETKDGRVPPEFVREEKKASISIHERLLRTIMRRNPGFSRRDAEDYISSGKIDKDIARNRGEK